MDFSPLDVTLEQALELLAQPKARRGGGLAQGAGQDVRRLAGHEPAGPSDAGPLRAVRQRRRDQRLAAPRHDAGGGHVRVRPEPLGRACRGRAEQAGDAQETGEKPAAKAAEAAKKPARRRRSA